MVPVPITVTVRSPGDICSTVLRTVWAATESPAPAATTGIAAASAAPMFTRLTPCRRIAVSICDVARQVDQVWLPERVSGHPALELNNTFGGWGLDRSRDYLVDYRVLVVLSRDVELLDGDESTALLEIAAQRP